MICTPEQGSVNTRSQYLMAITIIPNSPENTVQPEVAADETSTIPGVVREVSPDFSHQADRS